MARTVVKVHVHAALGHTFSAVRMPKRILAATLKSRRTCARREANVLILRPRVVVQRRIKQIPREEQIQQITNKLHLATAHVNFTVAVVVLRIGACHHRANLHGSTDFNNVISVSGTANFRTIVGVNCSALVALTKRATCCVDLVLWCTLAFARVLSELAPTTVVPDCLKRDEDTALGE